MSPRAAIPPLALVALVTGAVLAAAPHVARLPWWVTLLAASLLAWRGWAAWRNEPLPRRWLLMVLVVCGVVGVYVTHRTILGRDAGVTLLVLFLALKLLETKNDRDVVVVTFLCYFLALTNFFYSQSLPTAALAAATVLVLSTGLVCLNAPRRPLRESARVAGLLLAQSVPVMVILFFLFPRATGPLWGLPADAFSGTTGLSDSMTPGMISSLSQSEAIAFRVRFDGPPPERRHLYWRGPVFAHFDGQTWHGGLGPVPGPAAFEAVGDPIFYTVTLEAHERPWLFALEMAAKVPPDAVVTADYQLLARRPVRTRLRYDASSFLDYRARSATAEELAVARRLPPDSNPRAVALGQSWRKQLGDDRRILARAIEYFRGAGLAYTLRPPPLARDSVDEFLFGTRAGFCEHFSAAFAVVLRAAGVPARVVTGYQGGEVNPIDGHMTVRQADAHAWVEVWLADDGWVRVDPTAIAVPVRLDAGLASAVAPAELPLLARPDLSWLRIARFNWEAFASYWNLWVVGYNVDRQRELLLRFGMPAPSWEKMAMALFWLAGLVVAVFSLWLLRRSHADDPVTKVWRRFCAKLARRGTARVPHEGPRDFAARAAREHPDLAAEVAAISDLYVRLRYREDRDASLVAQLRQRVRAFRP
jgi:transglutaminase-like putative cysteine protease